MYKVLLRDIVTGEKHWYEDCYLNGKISKNLVVIWKGPKDDAKKRYKVIAWKWQGYDRRIPKSQLEIETFATSALLGLDIPDNWRKELVAWQNRNAKS